MERKEYRKEGIKKGEKVGRQREGKKIEWHQQGRLTDRRAQSRKE